MTTHSKVHFEIIGTGKPLVLVHGWGWHSGIWEPLISVLADKFQLFLIDLPGCGKSPLITASYTHEEITECLLEVTPSQAIWLGWSLGGMLAWHIAIKHPERVSHLITIASSPKFTSDYRWPGVLPHTLRKFSTLLIDNYQQTLMEFLALQLRGSPKNQAMLNNLKLTLTNTSPTSMPALLGGLELLANIDLREELTAMTCPSLHIFGSHDTLVPVGVSELIKPMLKHGQCEIIKRAGHIPFLSQADEFLACLLRFLKRTSI